MWGVPTLAGTFGGDAQGPDWEKGQEGLGALLAILCGAETGSGMGLMAGSTLLYPEALVMDSDIYHRIRRDLAGVDLTGEKLALDVIRDVGHRGHYLSQRHTRAHIRALGFSDLCAQPAANGGFRDPVEVARERTDWILEHHHPEPLETSKRRELERILDAAQAELG